MESGPNQLSGMQDVGRVTITVGKLAASDIFDNNAYSHDPRTQFFNWGLMDSAAWDYPANARGYDQGAAIELNQERWAVRYGIFMEPIHQNASDLAFHGMNNVSHVAELEERYAVSNRPGTARFLLFYSRNRQAYWDDAFASGGNINSAIDAARSYGHRKYGFAVNDEQQVTDSIGVFARLSWNDGKTEEWMFTQTDESASAGLCIKGLGWQRPADVWGIAGLVNGISGGQKRFLEAGGFGMIIGDGKLRYSPEMIAETYYSFKLTSYASLSPDYQFLVSPGYNADRGPVSIFSGRLHVEF